MTSKSKVPSIFVSYRIADTLKTADRLAAELQREFGANEVYFDRRTVEPGEVWDTGIERAVKGAAVVLVLIGKKWLTEQTESGRRRLDVPEDWVRREVEEALETEGLVIPVLVDDAAPPPREAMLAELPSMAALANRQAATLRTTDWDGDFGALVERLTAEGLAVLTVEESDRAVIPGRIATLGQMPFVGRSDELGQLATRLPPIGTAGVVVVRGKPGVGKSELAREYARQHQASYVNGAFFVNMEQGKVPVDLASYGNRNLGLSPSGLKIEDQCSFVLRNLKASTLLIYDNVTAPDAVRPWLPADDESTHVVITTTWEDWQGWADVEVKPLDDTHSLEVVEVLGGQDVAERFGSKLVSKAAGLPIQLCPATRSVAKALRRHSDAEVTISAEAEASFSDVWNRLEPDGRTLLAAATLFNPDRIRADWLRSRLEETGNWTAATVDAALNICLDLSLLDAGEELRMHRLLREFVRSSEGASPTELAAFCDAHSAAFVESAKALGEDPAKAELVADLMCHPIDLDDWFLASHPLNMSSSDFHSIGYGLGQIGLFDEARPWFERAVAATEQGDIHGRVDHASLGRSLHQVGFCLSRTGEYAEARPWYERAVAATEQGDIHGRLDHAELGKSLHQVGFCLSRTGEYAEARPWYERAVAATEQGDIHGRLDHAELGKSLHQVGFCLSETGEYAEARPWYERAVAVAEQGDIHGRVDHTELGKSLHCVGHCLSQTGQYAEARPWYERAVAVAEQGDIHGRVDHTELGKSLHCVGHCLSQTGQYAEARPWYERAVAATEQGDVHGRVDHESLGRSLHQVGLCLSETGEYGEARPWYERAVAATEQGDVHGRVDHASLGRSLHQVGFCLSRTGEYAEARPWYERAVAATEQGDIHGRLDHAELGKSLHQVGFCLSRTGEYAEARPWYERAVAATEQGDIHGRLDHAELGKSLHQVGFCLSETGEYAEARPWYERAVAVAEQGDIHGRVDHTELGKSLHCVGHCLSQTGQYAEARPWYERAVAVAEQGDIHGRVDHTELGKSLHCVGHCLSQTGQYAEARPWYERAVAAKEQGDVHGRVDHESLGRSLHQVGLCLSETGEYGEARPWYERAVAATERGDVHGRVDHQSLRVSQEALNMPNPPDANSPS